MVQFSRFVLAFLFLLQSEKVWANVGEAFGFGSRSGAVAGAMVGSGNEPFSAYTNPAALAQDTGEKRLNIAYGLLYIDSSFTPIQNIVKENSFNSDKVAGSPPGYGNADTDYRNTFGQLIGLSYHLLPDLFNLSVGLSAFFPVEQLAYMDTGEAFVPEYVLYRSRTQRPQADFGLGANLGHGIHLGVGFHFAYSLTSNSTVFINTGATSISSMRFAASMKPQLAPYLAFLFSSEEKTVQLGGVFRFAVSSDNTMALTSSARVFGKSAAIDFKFLSTSVLFYDPMAIELGGSLKIVDPLRVFLQLDYQFWGAYKIPALLIQQPPGVTCDEGTADCPSLPAVSLGAVPSFSFVNILVPRVGQELYLGENLTIRAGYGYRPSILSELPLGTGNYLDPPKHMFNAGLGWKFSKFLGFDAPAELDFHLSYQILSTQTIVKTAGNEAGVQNDPKIGTSANPAEGYQAGGNLFGGGISLSLAI